MTIYQANSILSLPYPERQLIVVGKEDDLSTKLPSKKILGALGAGVGIGSLALRVIKGLSLSNKILAGAVAIVSIGGFIYITMKKRENKHKDEYRILHIYQSQANELKFPIGNYKNGVVYVGHPLVPELYYPMAYFNKSILEHKIYELFDFLRSLGAAKICIRYLRDSIDERSS